MSDLLVDRRPNPTPSVVEAKPISTLEALRGELAHRTPTRTVTLEVESRPGFSVTFGLRLESARLATWREECRDELAPSGFNMSMFHRTIVGYTAVSINKDGAPIVDETGQPVNFRSQSFLQMYNVADPIEAVERFYDNDFFVDATANKVVDHAGFGREAKEVNPTRP